jgi:hypothetical protein
MCVVTTLPTHFTNRMTQRVPTDGVTNIFGWVLSAAEC